MTIPQTLNFRLASYRERLHLREAFPRLAAAVGAVTFFHLAYLHPFLAPFVICAALFTAGLLARLLLQKPTKPSENKTPA